MTRRRYGKNRKDGEPQGGGRDQGQPMKTAAFDQKSSENFESVSTDSYALAFSEIEQRASERFLEVVRMIDEFLKV